MFLAYGSYQHQIGGCSVSIDRTPIVNAAKVTIAMLETWTIQGMLTSQTGTNDLDTQIAKLMDAYSQDAQDLVLYLPDGVTPSSSAMLTLDTLGGTRVTQQPSFPSGQNAERVNFVHFTAKVEGERPLIDRNTLVDFHESLKFRGGTPAIGWLEPARGLPVQQILKQQTTFKVTQDGSATGYNWLPIIGYDVGIPIWPAALKPQMTEIGTETPERQGPLEQLGFKNWKVTWHYEFESLTPLIGFPMPWPANL